MIVKKRTIPNHAAPGKQGPVDFPRKPGRPKTRCVHETRMSKKFFDLNNSQEAFDLNNSLRAVTRHELQTNELPLRTSENPNTPSHFVGLGVYSLAFRDIIRKSVSVFLRQMNVNVPMHNFNINNAELGVVLSCVLAL